MTFMASRHRSIQRPSGHGHGTSRAKFLTMDKRNKNAIQNHRDDIVGKLGCLDIMVNSARIYHEAQEAKYSEQARETLDTNCYGTINVIKTFPEDFRSVPALGTLFINEELYKQNEDL